MPLIYWGLLALGGALGIGGTVATTDVVVEIGDAVEKSSNSINKLVVTAGIAGAGYFFAKSQKWI